MIKKRGLSPVVASVLLIGVVIALFVIVFLWMRSTMFDYGVKFNKNVNLVCEEVVFSADYQGSILSLVNDGDISIADFNIVGIKPGFKTTISLEDEYSFTGLNTGNSKEIDLENGLNDYTRIQVVPVLLAEFKNGEKKYPCENNIKEIEL